MASDNVAFGMPQRQLRHNRHVSHQTAPVLTTANVCLGYIVAFVNFISCQHTGVATSNDPDIQTYNLFAYTG